MALGQKLGEIIHLGQVVELAGDLGGGKTSLVKGIAKGLGIVKTVTSPSYNINRRYELPSGGFLEHFDLYRLNADEIVESEISEVIKSGQNVVVIEWAQNLGDKLADDRLLVELDYISENSRQITFNATGPTSQKVLSALKEQS